MKKGKIVLAITLVFILTCPLIANAETYYYITLPKYEGVYIGSSDPYAETLYGKLTTLTSGRDECNSISGGGSYAIEGNMINSDGAMRGAYHTCQAGNGYVYWTQTGTYHYNYYLRLRNHNSVSVDAEANGDWDCDQ